MDANAHAGDVVVNRLKPLDLAVVAQVIDVAGDAILDQQGLKNIRDLIG